jgi:hypothetical protein
MKIIKSPKPFRFSDDGLTVSEYPTGVVEVSDLCAKFATKHVGAKTVKAGKKEVKNA